MISESFKNTENSNIKHLLHAVHIASCHGKNPKKDLNNEITRNKVMPNATELFQAGVSFVKAGLPDKLGDIKFENGLMTIPCFRVYIFMMAQKSFCEISFLMSNNHPIDVQYKYFTDFITFMDHLIDSEKDVSSDFYYKELDGRGQRSG
ncbi:hypothetical protein MTR67_016551 [Solanum verrucosum]|uniref:Uncharacterized protein n=1 Tax=Solanum verrucosum TaxID=315347 RepID=A0AAF0TKR9_SOLVR|nr:hypothetical protein MTR67_016551 [Solanum verrucosum]